MALEVFSGHTGSSVRRQPPNGIWVHVCQKHRESTAVAFAAHPDDVGPRAVLTNLQLRTGKIVSALREHHEQPQFMRFSILDDVPLKSCGRLIVVSLPGFRTALAVSDGTRVLRHPPAQPDHAPFAAESDSHRGSFPGVRHFSGWAGEIGIGQLSLIDTGYTVRGSHHGQTRHPRTRRRHQRPAGR